MQTASDKELVAFCGLFCAECRAYKKGKCPGCAKNEKAKWCKIRTCNMENGYASCADCTTFSNVKECKKFNNFVSRLFEIAFRSDRVACLEMIRTQGYDKFTQHMRTHGLQVIKKGKQ